MVDSATPAKRKKIPAPTQHAVLLEAGYRCGNPACRGILTLELHHIEWVKDGGSNEPENLLALCPTCHSLHTNGVIPKEAIYAWKALLVSLSNPHRASLDLLLILEQEETRFAKGTEEKPEAPLPRFSGDSLPALASLITGGLIEISKRFSGAAWFGGGAPTFEVALTERGKLLVTAWKAGQPEAIKAALAHTVQRAT